jgi:hypothetical protein
MSSLQIKVHFVEQSMFSFSIALYSFHTVVLRPFLERDRKMRALNVQKYMYGICGIRSAKTLRD